VSFSTNKRAFHQIIVIFINKRAFYTLFKLEKLGIVEILARLRSKVRYGKSEKARLAAVAVAVFAVIKEPQVTALFPVRLFIAHPPNS
jgi:hypothetical protein